MHKNRKNIGTYWPVPKKGTKYIARSSHNNENSIPLSVLLRDVLKVVRTTKELKKVLQEKLIQINGKEINNHKYPVGLFDVVSIDGRNLRIIIGANKKFKAEDIGKSDAEIKVIKIIGKKQIGKDKIQFNLVDGRNIISNENAFVGDSVVYNHKTGKITKILKLEKGNDAFVVKGKHAGFRGKITGVLKEGGKTIAVIDMDKNKINVWTKNIIVMENGK